MTTTSFSGASALLTLYYATLGVLALYGLHRLVLVAAYFRTRNRRPAPPPSPAAWSQVTVQLPLYNEMYVATRLLDAVCAFDYPAAGLLHAKGDLIASEPVQPGTVG